MNERRTRTLTDADIDALTCAIHGGVTPEEHIAHHAAIRTMINRENRKAERAEKLKVQIAGWGIVTILGSIGTGAYHGLQYIKEHLR